MLENSIIPTAVTAFDIQSLQGIILNKGSMARAARASATFPILIPTRWLDIASTNQQEEEDDEQNKNLLQ